MSRTLAVFFPVALWALFSAALLWPGALSITKHSGDALHMIAIVERLAMGQLPHLDFMTPIGMLAFAPIAWLVGAGFKVEQAFLIVKVLMGDLLGALAWLSAQRRMSPAPAAAFALLVLVLTMALVHGGKFVAV